jgi:hypothetical protein
LNADEVRRAAALIGAGLQRRLRPTDGSDYAAMLDRYRTDPDFQELVGTVADGLGLEILGAPRFGLMLAPVAGSPFAMRLTDFREGMTVEERLVAGLIILGLAAYAYPNEVDLDDPAVRSVEIGRLEKFLRGAVQPIVDSPVTDDVASNAAQLYDAMPELLVSEKTGRRRKGCSLRAIEEVMNWLVEQGMARDMARTLNAVDTFQLTDRFRIQVAELAGDTAFTVLRDIRHGATGPAEELAG